MKHDSLAQLSSRLNAFVLPALTNHRTWANEMRTSRSIQVLLAGLLLSPVTIRAETITHTTSTDGKTEIWQITEPVVTQPTTEYPQIKFLPGDAVTVQA